MKIILLLLDEKQEDSEQHGCFSLGFIHHPIQLFPPFTIATAREGFNTLFL